MFACKKETEAATVKVIML